LLMLAKMEYQQLVLNRIAVDLNQLVQTVVQDHMVIAQSRGIELTTVSLPAETGTIMLDVPLFQRVLDNLLSNALKFAPIRSTVTIRLEHLNSKLPAAGLIRMSVSNEGPTIPEEDQERVFDKYEIVSLHQAKTAQVGLGLAFCKLVVEAHGGRIWVESNKPTGAIFTIEIG
jgi:two-component system, sensor histidine kinase and response regulator